MFSWVQWYNKNNNNRDETKQNNKPTKQTRLISQSVDLPVNPSVYLFQTVMKTGPLGVVCRHCIGTGLVTAGTPIPVLQDLQGPCWRSVLVLTLGLAFTLTRCIEQCGQG